MRNQRATFQQVQERRIADYGGPRFIEAPSTHKIHKHVQIPGMRLENVTVCGAGVFGSGPTANITDDPSAVTCGTCLRKIAQRERTA